MIDAKVGQLKEQTRIELKRLPRSAARSRPSRPAGVEGALVESNTKRISAIEAGDQIVVGVNKWENGEPSPLTAGERSDLHRLGECRDGG